MPVGTLERAALTGKSALLGQATRVLVGTACPVKLSLDSHCLQQALTSLAEKGVRLKESSLLPLLSKNRSCRKAVRLRGFCTSALDTHLLHRLLVRGVVYSALPAHSQSALQEFSALALAGCVPSPSLSVCVVASVVQCPQSLFLISCR